MLLTDLIQKPVDCKLKIDFKNQQFYIIHKKTMAKFRDKLQKYYENGEKIIFADIDMNVVCYSHANKHSFRGKIISKDVEMKSATVFDTDSGEIELCMYHDMVELQFGNRLLILKYPQWKIYLYGLSTITEPRLFKPCLSTFDGELFTVVPKSENFAQLYTNCLKSCKKIDLLSFLVGMGYCNAKPDYVLKDYLLDNTDLYKVFSLVKATKFKIEKEKGQYPSNLGSDMKMESNMDIRSERKMENNLEVDRERDICDKVENGCQREMKRDSAIDLRTYKNHPIQIERKLDSSTNSIKISSETHHTLAQEVHSDNSSINCKPTFNIDVIPVFQKTKPTSQPDKYNIPISQKLLETKTDHSSTLSMIDNNEPSKSLHQQQQQFVKQGFEETNILNTSSRNISSDKQTSYPFFDNSCHKVNEHLLQKSHKETSNDDTSYPGGEIIPYACDYIRSGDTFEGAIISASGVNSIFMLLKTEYARATKINKRLLQLSKNSSCIAKTYDVGQICSAYYQDKKLWFRSRILEVHQNAAGVYYKCYCLDFGFIFENLKHCDTLPLTQKLIKAPLLCCQVSLYNTVWTGGETGSTLFTDQFLPLDISVHVHILRVKRLGYYDVSISNNGEDLFTTLYNSNLVALPSADIPGNNSNLVALPSADIPGNNSNLVALPSADIPGNKNCSDSNIDNDESNQNTRLRSSNLLMHNKSVKNEEESLCDPVDYLRSVKAHEQVDNMRNEPISNHFKSQELESDIIFQDDLNLRPKKMCEEVINSDDERHLKKTLELEIEERIDLNERKIRELSINSKSSIKIEDLKENMSNNENNSDKIMIENKNMKLQEFTEPSVIEEKSKSNFQIDEHIGTCNEVNDFKSIKQDTSNIDGIFYLKDIEKIKLNDFNKFNQIIAFILEYNSANNFYVMIYNLHEELTKLLNELSSINFDPKLKCNEYVAKTNEVVLVKVNEQFHRGCIICFHVSSNKYEIKLIDEGSSVQSFPTDIMKLPSNLAVYRCLSVQCYLRDYKCIQSNCDISKILKRYGDRAFELRVHKLDETNDSSNPKFQVSIYDPKSHEDIFKNLTKSASFEIDTMLDEDELIEYNQNSEIFYPNVPTVLKITSSAVIITAVSSRGPHDFTCLWRGDVASKLSLEINSLIQKIIQSVSESNAKSSNRINLQEGDDPIPKGWLAKLDQQLYSANPGHLVLVKTLHNSCEKWFRGLVLNEIKTDNCFSITGKYLIRTLDVGDTIISSDIITFNNCDKNLQAKLYWQKLMKLQILATPCRMFDWQLSHLKWPGCAIERFNKLIVGKGLFANICLTSMSEQTSEQHTQYSLRNIYNIVAPGKPGVSVLQKLVQENLLTREMILEHSNSKQSCVINGPIRLTEVTNKSKFGIQSNKDTYKSETESFKLSSDKDHDNLNKNVDFEDKKSKDNDSSFTHTNNEKVNLDFKCEQVIEADDTKKDPLLKDVACISDNKIISSEVIEADDTKKDPLLKDGASISDNKIISSEVIEADDTKQDPLFKDAGSISDNKIISSEVIEADDSKQDLLFKDTPGISDNKIIISEVIEADDTKKDTLLKDSATISDHKFHISNNKIINSGDLKSIKSTDQIKINSLENKKYISLCSTSDEEEEESMEIKEHIKQINDQENESLTPDCDKHELVLTSSEESYNDVDDMKKKISSENNTDQDVSKSEDDFITKNIFINNEEQINESLNNQMKNWDLKEMNNKLSQEYKEKITLKKRISILENENSNLIVLNNKLSQDNKEKIKLKNRISALENENSKLSQENEEKMDLTKKISSLELGNSDLNVLNDKLSNELEALSEKYEALKKKFKFCIDNM